MDPKRGKCFWEIRKLAIVGTKQFLRPSNAFDFSDVKFLKSGTNSRLYLAKNDSNEIVAIKMLKPNASKNSVHEYELNVEITILSKLQHYNIISVYSSGKFPRSYVEIEYLPGGTLDDILKSSTPILPIRTALSHAYSLISALRHLHDAAHPEITIIHRDVKPHNVGFSAGGQLKLFDFGLATCIPRRTLASDAYQLSGLTGTLAYMAPEVALELPYSEKVDVFSFAVVLWQFLTGSSPFSGPMTLQKYQKTVAVEEMRPSLLLDCGEMEEKDVELRKELLLMVEQCWSGDPLTRPSSAVTAQQLEQLLLKSTNQVAPHTSSSWKFLGKMARNMFKSSSTSHSVVPFNCEISDSSGDEESLRLQVKKKLN